MDKTKKDETEKKEVEQVEEEEIVLEEELPHTELPVIMEPEEASAKIEKRALDYAHWTPKTEVGRKVKMSEINDISLILDNGLKILEPEIVDILLPNLEVELLMVGQSKGK